MIDNEFMNYYKFESSNLELIWIVYGFYKFLAFASVRQICSRSYIFMVARERPTRKGFAIRTHGYTGVFTGELPIKCFGREADGYE